MRVAQAALGVEEGLRRGEEVRVAGVMEVTHRLSIVTNGLVEERNKLVSVIFEGFGGQFLSQQGQPGIHLQERLGVEEMKLKQMEREVENAKAWGSMHLAVNETLRKRVSNSKICTRFPFFLCSAGGHGGQFYVVVCRQFYVMLVVFVCYYFM